MLILGTKYDLVQNDATLKDINADGACSSYEKVIRIAPLKDMLQPDDSEQAKRKRYNEVLRHEMIHAFFDESGLDQYSDDEQLVNWLAVQFPKMLKAFAAADCVTG